jgi:hypothetical protein
MKLLITNGYAAAIALFVTLTVSSVMSNVLDNNPSPLRILLGVPPATRSHALPLLEIGRELITRGHDVYFATQTPCLKWASDQPKMKLISMGDDVPSRESIVARYELFDNGSNKNPEKYYRYIIKRLFTGYAKQYPLYRDIISGQSQHGGPMDVVMCDFFARYCIDAAHSLDVPCVIRIRSLDYEGLCYSSYLFDTLI